MHDRVLIISSWYPSDDNPAQGVFVEDQALALRDRYRVAVIAPRLGGWRDRIRGRSTDVQVELRRGVDVVRVGAIAAIPRSRRSAYSAYLAAVRRAYREAVDRFGRPDILHAHVVRHAGWAAVHVGREVGVPVVLTEHSGPFSMHLEHSIDRRNVAWALRGSDAVVAVSPSLRDAIREFLPVDVTVVGNAVDTQFFSPIAERRTRSHRADPLRVLTAALLVPSKRIDRVLEAVAMLRSRTERPIEVAIVGDGPERPSLEARASALGIRAHTRFVGLVGRADVRDEMRKADVFVLVSDSETFGLVLAEAMACGTPVIATRAGGPEFIIEAGCGQLVPVGDVGAIAEALEGFAEGSTIIDLDAARVSIMQRFGFGPFVDAIGGIYDRVLASRAEARRSLSDAGPPIDPI